MASGDSLAGWRFLVPLLALAVLVLQHRSVWVASFVPAMLAFVVVRQSQAKLAGRLAVIAALTAIVLGPLLVSGKLSTATTSVAESAEKATSTTSGTFVGRVEGWEALLKQWSASGPRTWAMGNPYGSGYKRTIEQAGGRDITYAPHNYFVQLLLRTGVIGLLAFLALQWRLLKGAIRLAGAPHAAMTGYAMIGLLVSNLLFDFPYSPNYLHGLFTGMILGLLLQYERREREGHSAPADLPPEADTVALPQIKAAR
jgi:O-antigen ligase